MSGDAEKEFAALLPGVSATAPAHLHVDDDVEAPTLLVQCAALYGAARRATHTQDRVMPLLTIGLATSAEKKNAPQWQDVARDAATQDEPPAVYLVDAAAFRAQPRAYDATTLDAFDGLPPRTRVEYRTSRTDDGWSRRIVAFPEP